MANFVYTGQDITAQNVPWRWLREIAWLNGHFPHDPAPADAASQLLKLDPSLLEIFDNLATGTTWNGTAWVAGTPYFGYGFSPKDVD
jgi:hypothetical protein